MERERWTKYLEVSSNVAVIIVAVVLLGAIVSARLGRPGKIEFESGLQRGQMLARLPSVDYGAASQTLVLALSTKCSYCQQSLPFYKRIAGELQNGRQRTQIVAVFPNANIDVEKYKQENQLNMECVTVLNHDGLKVTGTPTLILVDSNGRVLDFWVGMLSKDEERQAIEAVVN